MSGAHSHIFSEVLKLLEEADASDIKIIAGGIIPDDEKTIWESKGIFAIFGPGTPTHDIVDYIVSNS